MGANNWRTDVRFPITIFRRSRRFIWFCGYGAGTKTEYMPLGCFPFQFVYRTMSFARLGVCWCGDLHCTLLLANCLLTLEASSNSLLCMSGSFQPGPLGNTR